MEIQYLMKGASLILIKAGMSQGFKSKAHQGEVILIYGGFILKCSDCVW